ncbi:MAG: PhnD/SsuA/transferrin family substrate-binding protein [Rhizobiales bacterium]|nr:PhnD/SsuA/transferrin family substrate-binding protein [Hyphomicrobiales bacterium]
MEFSKGLSRRAVVGGGLGMLGASLVGGPAYAKQEMQILGSYFKALMNTSPIAVGLAKGFYDTSNVKVSEVVSTIGGGTAIRNMVGGGLNYGFVGTSGALTAIREGIDIKIVHGVLNNMRDLFWVAMPDSPVNSIQDLKGRKVGFTKPKSVSETMVKWMLRRHNLTNDVEMVSLGGLGAGLSALEQGGVDAALILEPLWSKRKDRYKVVFDLSELPPMVQMVGVATGDFIRNSPDVVRDLAKAWRNSVEFTLANPDDAAAIMAESYTDKVMDLEVAKSAVKHMIEIDFWSRGKIDRDGLGVWVQTMVEQGEWEGEPDWSKIIDDSLLDADLR